MKGTDTRPVAIGLRVYCGLAAAFPHEFRNVYGDAMTLTAEDAVEMIWRERGWLGIVHLLLDVALRIPAEYAGEIRQDVRYGLRMLRASPGFSAVALVSLTLGIGVATAAFSEMNGFIMRDVPGVAKPDELVALKAPVAISRRTAGFASKAHCSRRRWRMRRRWRSEWRWAVDRSGFGDTCPRPHTSQLSACGRRSGDSSAMMKRRSRS